MSILGHERSNTWARVQRDRLLHCELSHRYVYVCNAPGTRLDPTGTKAHYYIVGMLGATAKNIPSAGVNIVLEQADRLPKVTAHMAYSWRGGRAAARWLKEKTQCHEECGAMAIGHSWGCAAAIQVIRRYERLCSSEGKHVKGDFLGFMDPVSITASPPTPCLTDGPWKYATRTCMSRRNSEGDRLRFGKKEGS